MGHLAFADLASTLEKGKSYLSADILYTCNSCLLTESVRLVFEISIRQIIIMHSSGIGVWIEILQNRYGLSALTLVVSTL